MKTAFLCFFPVIPTNMGSAEVIRSLFLAWPGDKKIFQISHLKINQKKNLKSIFILYEKPILKLICIPIIIFKILNYLKGSDKKLVVIEGPSWIGYSFLSLILIKLFSPKTKVIYHSHSIEYEVRKMMSSHLIAIFSKLLEKFVFKYSDLSTSVSKIEINKINKLYKVKCVELRNGVSKKIIKFKKKKLFNFNYIIYCGSYKYLPNKLAIDFLINQLMPRINKKFPKLKLLLTGGGFSKKKNFLLNLGILPKSKLLNIIYNSKLMVLPIDKGTGTRIKIIEAILIGAKILTTKKGIEGISLKKNKNINIRNKKLFYNYIKKNIYNKNKIKFSQSDKNKYIMENIVDEFINDKNVQKLLKTN